MSNIASTLAPPTTSERIAEWSPSRAARCNAGSPAFGGEYRPFGADHDAIDSGAYEVTSRSTDEIASLAGTAADALPKSTHGRSTQNIDTERRQHSDSTLRHIGASVPPSCGQWGWAEDSFSGRIQFLAVTKWSVSVEQTLAARVESHVGDRGLSGFVARAVEHELERDLLAEYLDELDVEYGVLPKGVVEQFDELWPS